MHQFWLVYGVGIGPALLCMLVGITALLQNAVSWIGWEIGRM
jgi:hypothetical protein